MSDFTCNVTRERFTIEYDDGRNSPVIALSNRVRIELMDDRDRVVETFILRGQMLHTVVRLAGAILNAYTRTGPLLNRVEPIDWLDLWHISSGTHERTHNPDLWVAIYHDGKPIFERGNRHPFLDVIEQCDRRSNGSYENALLVAEQMFAQAGKAVNISHDNNIACTFQIGADQGRSALILRGAQKTTTFVFTGDKKAKDKGRLNPVHFINAAAAFLEGIQLSFTIGMGNEKLRRELIELYDEDGKKLTSARARLAELNAAIRTFENLHTVHYRPEKPEFPALIINAEEVTARRLDAEMMANAREQQG